MRAAIVFDDGQGRLGPLTDLRASFEVRTGALTTLERLAAMLEAQADCRVVGVAPRPEIAALTTERLEMPSLDAARLEALAQGEMGDDAVIVNGRCVMPPVGVEQLVPGSAIVHRGTGAVLAARLAWREVGAFLLGRLLNDGKMPQRLLYPTQPKILNSANYNAAVQSLGGDNINVKDWWNQ